MGSLTTLRAASAAAAFEVLLLIVSAAAAEWVSPASDRCTDDITERGQSTETKVYTGQKISLDFRDADIVNVLRILAEVGGENVVITDDVKGRITLRLVDVPSDQALDIVLQMNRLGCTKVFTWKAALRP